MSPIVPLRAVINLDVAGPVISRHIYGHFAEHLGRFIYGGFWVGEDSEIPNEGGIRLDVVEARVPCRFLISAGREEASPMSITGVTESAPSKIDHEWSTPTDSRGTVYAAGIHGQFIWIDPISDTVIAKFSSYPQPLALELSRAHAEGFKQMISTLEYHQLIEATPGSAGPQESPLSEGSMDRNHPPRVFRI